MEDISPFRTGCLLFTSLPHPCNHSWMEQDTVPEIYPPKTTLGNQVAISGKIMTMASPTSDTIV